MLLNEVLSVSGILYFLHGFILELISLIYVKTTFLKDYQTGPYLYADNICISCKYKLFEKIEAALNKEFSSICHRFAENKCSIRNSLVWRANRWVWNNGASRWNRRSKKYTKYQGIDPKQWFNFHAEPRIWNSQSGFRRSKLTIVTLEQVWNMFKGNNKEAIDFIVNF